jgi:hypothetical protein
MIRITTVLDVKESKRTLYRRELQRGRGKEIRWGRKAKAG